MDSSFSASFTGIAQVDVCTRRGNTNFYDLEIQVVAVQPCGDDLDSNQIELKASMYSEDGAYDANAIIFISATWVGLAQGYVDINTHTKLFDGEAPRSFEPSPGTMHVVGQVMEK